MLIYFCGYISLIDFCFIICPKMINGEFGEFVVVITVFPMLLNCYNMNWFPGPQLWLCFLPSPVFRALHLFLPWVLLFSGFHLFLLIALYLHFGGNISVSFWEGIQSSIFEILWVWKHFILSDLINWSFGYRILGWVTLSLKFQMLCFTDI